MENKWDYEEIIFAEIDLSPLKEGKPARTFRYTNEEKTTGFVITILQGKKDPSKNYVKVEFARKQIEEPQLQSKENIEDVPF